MQLDKLSTDPVYLTALLQRMLAELSQAIAQRLAIDVTAGLVAADNARLMAEVADLRGQIAKLGKGVDNRMGDPR